jgi:hypothetical protein
MLRVSKNREHPLSQFLPSPWKKEEIERRRYPTRNLWRNRMLYNKSTGQPVADVMSINSLVAWLEKKPAEGTYSYINGARCLIAQYLQENGFPEARVSAHTYRKHSGGENQKLPKEFHEIAIGGPNTNNVIGPTTFGAALNRAKAYQDGARK